MNAHGKILKSLLPFAFCLAAGPAACTDAPGGDSEGTTGTEGDTDPTGESNTDPDSTGNDSADTGDTDDTAVDCEPAVEPTLVQRDTGATVEVYDRCGITVHSYVATPDVAGNGLQIIETADALVLIDAQFVPTVSQDYRAYADSLGKPIERIIITHEHRDHWVGLGAAFTDIDAYSSAGVLALLEGGGLPLWQSFQPTPGSALSPGFMVPTLEIQPGTEVIDGVTFEYSVYVDNEAEEALVIHLPEYGVLAVGDIVYNGYHGIMAGDDVFSGWSDALASLQELPNVEMVLPGHGAPGNASVLADMAGYIEAASNAFATASGPEDYRVQMESLYPDRLGGDQFFGITLGRLYPPPQERADTETANELVTVGTQPGYPEPAPADGFASKNCAYFDLGPGDDYLGLDPTQAQHEVCLLNTYTGLKHRIITTVVDPADQDLYDRHRAYVDRFTVSVDGQPLSEIYDLTCNGGDCQSLFASDPVTRTPIFENIAQLFAGDSEVTMQLTGGGFVNLSFFVPRAGPSSLIPHQLVSAQLPRFGQPDELVGYDASADPIRIPEIEYPRGQPVINDNAFGLSCETAEGAQHEAQRYLVRYREAQATRAQANEYPRVLGLLNVEYNTSGESEQGYFSVHVLWSPIPEVDPGADPNTYLHERIVIPKQQNCIVSGIDPIETVPPAEAEAALADGESLTAWLEAQEAEVAPS